MIRRAHFALVGLVAVGAVVALAGCPGHTRVGARLGPAVDEHGAPVEPEKLPPPVEIAHDERTVSVTVPTATGDKPAALGALLVHPLDKSLGNPLDKHKHPAILVVPGASDVSRKGTRIGDGVSKYKKPVDVTVAWADAFAKRGAMVLSWDKRTCGPNDDPVCAKNPQDDVDAAGPVALAKDVDAACALIKTEPDFDGRIVLFAHAQAAQVALSSACAKEAAVIVLIAPIPRAVDEVIVAGLKDRTAAAEHAAKSEHDAANKGPLFEEANQLKNLAATREAEFASIRADRFEKTARIQGATIAFWKGWMDLTAKTPALVDAVTTPKIVVLGQRDVQYSEKDRVRIRALAPQAFLEVKGADHHLLTDGKLDSETVDMIGAALDAILSPKG